MALSDKDKQTIDAIVAKLIKLVGYRDDSLSVSIADMLDLGLVLPAGGGSGTVTSVSVTTGNGFGGSVATATTTPAITLTTGVTGLIKGNGTALSAAISGTDYLVPANITGKMETNGSNAASTIALPGATDITTPATMLLNIASGGDLDLGAPAGDVYLSASAAVNFIAGGLDASSIMGPIDLGGSLTGLIRFTSTVPLSLNLSDIVFDENASHQIIVNTGAPGDAQGSLSVRAGDGGGSGDPAGDLHLNSGKDGDGNPAGTIFLGDDDTRTGVIIARVPNGNQLLMKAGDDARFELNSNAFTIDGNDGGTIGTGGELAVNVGGTLTQNLESGWYTTINNGQWNVTMTVPGNSSTWALSSDWNVTSPGGINFNTGGGNGIFTVADNGDIHIGAVNPGGCSLVIDSNSGTMDIGQGVSIFTMGSPAGENIIRGSNWHTDGTGLTLDTQGNGEFVANGNSVILTATASGGCFLNLDGGGQNSTLSADVSVVLTGSQSVVIVADSNELFRADNGPGISFFGGATTGQGGSIADATDLASAISSLNTLLATIRNFNLIST